MPASDHTIELISTKDITQFVPLMSELADDFGDRFLLSMLHWCGIGNRNKPLQSWEVFLLGTDHGILGVGGLYRLPEKPANHVWLGWFGIRSAFRRRGYGTAAMSAIVDRARSMDYNELWVYTGSSDEAARSFYTKLGFELLGSARDYAPGQTMDGSDMVLKLRLDLPETIKE
jgi:RimJ/RimL family protein N-acetyltransferase